MFTLGVVVFGMQLTREQFTRIEHVLPVQRGNVVIDNFTLINAILFVALNGCTWRALPERYGRWHTVYMRMRRWAKNGVLTKVFQELQTQDMIYIDIESLQIDSTSIKVHPDGTGKRKKAGPQATHRSRGGLNTKLHLVATGLQGVLGFLLTPGQVHDARPGRELLQGLGIEDLQVPLIMDKAYEGNETRQLAESLGFQPVVPPKANRLDPWEYDVELYKKRNEIERLIGRIKRFRRVFTRYDKTDIMFCAFITVALIANLLR